MATVSSEYPFLKKPAGSSVRADPRQIGTATEPIDEIFSLSGTYTNIDTTTINGGAYPPAVAPTFADNVFAVTDAVDPTIRVTFDAAGAAGTDTQLRMTQAANRIITFADAGADANVILSEGAQSINGEKTFNDNINVNTIDGVAYPPPAPSAIDNVFAVLDNVDNTIRVAFDAAGAAATTTTIRATQVADRVMTIPDVGADANVVLSEGAQSINGIKTFNTGIATDTISEVTLNNGVQIDEVTIQSGPTIGINVSSIQAASGAAANVYLALVPLGNGSITAQIPDNGIAGGVARGSRAVDFQRDRTVSSQVASGVYSFIGNGFRNTASGFTSATVNGVNNNSSADRSFIGSGINNTSSGLNAFIGAGDGNTADSADSCVVGGQNNTANDVRSGILAGVNNNTALSVDGCIVAGNGNTLGSGDRAFIGAGLSNTVGNQANSAIVAGNSNVLLGPGGFIGAGTTNTIANTSSQGVIGGGLTNNVTQSYGAIAGGTNNTSSGTAAFVGGGDGNTASNIYATVAGGTANTASTAHCAVGGGTTNLASGFAAVVSGGDRNTASGDSSVVCGGQLNVANAQYAIVLGGFSNRAIAANASCITGTSNTADNTDAICVGGDNNTASGVQSFVGGGFSNRTDAAALGGVCVAGASCRVANPYGVVIGGQLNTASNNHATVIGGFSNTASGNRSIAGGANATASGANSVALNGVATLANSCVINATTFVIGSNDTGAGTGLGNHANDAAAAAALVPLGGFYHTAGALRVRIV